MCLAVYLASSTPIPASVHGASDAPGIYLKAVKAGVDVLRQFSVPYVYYVGSQEGCGCGFIKEGRTDDDLLRSQADYTQLAELIRCWLAEGATIELFSCWEGGQAKSPVHSETLGVESLEAPDFEFEEDHFVSVR